MTLPREPLSRSEQYLNVIATGEGILPPKPLSRNEQYLDYICKNGSGSGDTHDHNNKEVLDSIKQNDLDDISKIYKIDTKLSDHIENHPEGFLTFWGEISPMQHTDLKIYPRYQGENWVWGKSSNTFAAMCVASECVLESYGEFRIRNGMYKDRGDVRDFSDAWQSASSCLTLAYGYAIETNHYETYAKMINTGYTNVRYVTTDEVPPIMEVQQVYGATSSIETYRGSKAQIVVNTDTYNIHIMDGITPGGHIVGSSSTRQISLEERVMYLEDVIKSIQSKMSDDL